MTKKQTEEQKQAERSYILIEFPGGLGTADCAIKPINATQGQVEAAAFRLHTLAARHLNDELTQAMVEDMQSRAQLQSILTAKDLKQQ